MTASVSSRQEEIESALPADLDALPRLDGFRLRGMQMTRLETFIDAAFAFAITMLVIAAQQIPDDIAAPLAAFRNVPTFIFSIFIIGIFWPGHGFGAGDMGWKMASRSSSVGRCSSPF